MQSFQLAISSLVCLEHLLQGLQSINGFFHLDELNVVLLADCGQKSVFVSGFEHNSCLCTRKKGGDELVGELTSSGLSP
jgi:hypothetical protein